MSPVLTTASATLVSGGITASYVGALYIARSARLSFANTTPWPNEGERLRQPNERWRDDDDVIQARLKAAILTSCFNCGIVYIYVAAGYDGHERWRLAIGRSLRVLGMSIPSFQLKSLFPHMLTPLLYAGPLTAQALSQKLPFQRHWSYTLHFRPMVSTWIGLRNYVVAPITEELVFRACLQAVADLSGRGTYHKIFVTPLWFGVAHLHHAYELYNRFGRTRSALMRAALTCFIQLLYTTLFGAYTSWLLLHTGSILPSITAHIMANVMGLPQLSWELRQHPNYKLLICSAYATGIAGFISVLVLDTW